MLESKHCCCELCTIESRYPEKSLNATNCTRILRCLTKPWAVTVQIPRTFRAAVATSRSEYFTVKRITKKLICCLSWSSREDWSADLCQKFPNYPSRPLITNTIEPEDIIIISETIPNSEQNLVCCAIWRTMILIEPFIRPHKQICYREQTSTAYIS